jgi:MTH538 TIR-like domain (DUF1863)
MPRGAFFSFHYSRDIWRANVVRNCWLTHADREAAGFWDGSLWEKTKLEGRQAIHDLIDDGLFNTSVTVVLIGAQTSTREYVTYEIEESRSRGKGLLGIYINNIENQKNEVDLTGDNPFDSLYTVQNGMRVKYSSIYPSYYWYGDDGYEKIGKWIEVAAKAAGR